MNELVWRIDGMILTGKPPRYYKNTLCLEKFLNPMYVSYKVMTFVIKWVDYAPCKAQRY
jgi:hypothetical protein